MPTRQTPNKAITALFVPHGTLKIWLECEIDVFHVAHKPVNRINEPQILTFAQCLKHTM